MLVSTYWENEKMQISYVVDIIKLWCLFTRVPKILEHLSRTRIFTIFEIPALISADTLQGRKWRDFQIT